MKIQTVGAHFHPLSWKIHLPNFDSKNLDSDPVAQSVFVHEYTHYLQFLSSAYGVRCMYELFRISVNMAYHYKFGSAIPKTISPDNKISVLDMLAANIKAKLSDEVTDQVKYLVSQLEFSFGEKYALVSLIDRKPTTYPFDSEPLTLNGKTYHVKVLHSKWRGQEWRVYVTERIIFENMARQLQKCYSIFAGEPAMSHMASYQADQGEVLYMCLHNYLAENIGPGEDASTWTYALCQYCLRAVDSTAVLIRCLHLLRSSPHRSDLSRFLAACDRDTQVAKGLNKYDLGKMNEDLSMLSRGVCSSQEAYDIHQAFMHVCNVYNDFFVDGTRLLNYSGLFWKDVKTWVARYGCPSIVFRDREVPNPFDAPSQIALLRYFGFVREYYELHVGHP